SKTCESNTTYQCLLLSLVMATFSNCGNSAKLSVSFVKCSKGGSLLRVTMKSRKPFFLENRLSFLKKRIAAFLCLVGHVGETCRLAGKNLLPHHAVVGEVHGELQHFDRCGRFGQDFLRPFVGRRFEF